MGIFKDDPRLAGDLKGLLLLLLLAFGSCAAIRADWIWEGLNGGPFPTAPIPDDAPFTRTDGLGY